MAADLNCPFIKDNLVGKYFKKYIQYLTRLLQGTKYKKILEDSPQIIQAYAQVRDIAELKF